MFLLFCFFFFLNLLALRNGCLHDHVLPNKIYSSLKPDRKSIPASGIYKCIFSEKHFYRIELICSILNKLCLFLIHEHLICAKLYLHILESKLRFSNNSVWFFKKSCWANNAGKISVLDIVGMIFAEIYVKLKSTFIKLFCVNK